MGKREAVFPSVAPRVRVREFALTRGQVRVRIESGEPQALGEAGRARWEELRAENPKYFDAPMLAFRSFRDAENTVIAVRERYARFAVQPQVATGVRLLAVTGVVMSMDAQGREHVLLGRRGDATRQYPGMWEFGPAGGLDVPADESVLELNEGALLAQLAREAREEIGIDLRDDALEWCAASCLLSDDEACSDDMVLVVMLRERAESLVARLAPHAWEYQEVRLVPLDTLAMFDAEEAERIIPPTRALFRALGWMDRE